MFYPRIKCNGKNTFDQRQENTKLIYCYQMPGTTEPQRDKALPEADPCNAAK